MKRTILVIGVAICLATPLFAAQTATDSPQSIYLQAGKEERSGSADKARELYESIIDRFPESEFAVKANDRLLTMAPLKTVSAPPAPAATGTSIPGSELFTTAQPKPLPSEPGLRAAVEAARLKEKAEITYREEIERLKRVNEARMGRKLHRANLSENEKEWRQTAERKVVEVCGMPLKEIVAKADAKCRELGIKGECNEEHLTGKAVQ